MYHAQCRVYMTYTECLGIYMYTHCGSMRLARAYMSYHKFMILANVGKYASPVDPLEYMPGT